MSYGYRYSSGEPAFAVFMMIFTMIYILVMFGIVAAAYISRWFIFKKMGMPGWKGIIPYKDVLGACHQRRRIRVREHFRSGIRHGGLRCGSGRRS